MERTLSVRSARVLGRVYRHHAQREILGTGDFSFVRVQAGLQMDTQTHTRHKCTQIGACSVSRKESV
jgi:hypothetical protein